MQKKEDRRIQRTRYLLCEALLDLMIEKGYQAITVQDIIDRANVGRSTFYSHFVDKEELLISTINQLRDSLEDQKACRPSPKKVGEYRFNFSLPMLQHVQSNRLLFKATVGKKGGAVVSYHIQQMLTDLASDDIKQLLPDTAALPIPQSVAVELVVNTFFTLLTWWVNQSMPCSATELDSLFHRITLSGLNSFK